MRHITLNEEVSPASQFKEDHPLTKSSHRIQEASSKLLIPEGSLGSLRCQRFLTFIALLALIYGNYIFINQPRKCTYDTQLQCFTFFFMEDVTFNAVLSNQLFSALAFGLVFMLAILKSIDRQFIYIAVINFLAIIVIFHQPPSVFNISYLYTYLLVKLTIVLVVIAGSIFIACLIGRLALRSPDRRALWLYLASVSLILFTLYSSFEHRLQPNLYWFQGVVDVELYEHDVNGNPYCKLKIPKVDHKNILDGLLDISYHYYDCTKQPYTNHELDRQTLTEYFPKYDGERFISFPLLDQVFITLHAKLSTPHERRLTQEFIMNQAFGWDRLADIPSQTEYILDTQTMKYMINLTRNEALIEERAEAHAEYQANRSAVGIREKPFKNLIILYIDTLSRMAFGKKLPKFFNWYSTFMKKNGNEFNLTQSMRFHPISTYTYHNLMAYHYGAWSNEDNVYETSPFSMTRGATNKVVKQEVNKRTGIAQNKTVLRGQLQYKSFVDGLKDKGYITSVVSTDCSVTPLTQEETNLYFLDPIHYDHSGIIPSCDPNFFMPRYRTGSGMGPYSVFRRCLYGVEQADYALEYAHQFMQAYSDQPKHLSLEFIEGHERTQEVVKYLDDKLVSFFTWLEENGHMEDSIIMFLSDHGMHMINPVEYVERLGLNYRVDNSYPIQIIMIHRGLLGLSDIQRMKFNEQKMMTLFETHYFLKYLTATEPIYREFYRQNSIVSDVMPVSRSVHDLPAIRDVDRVCYPIN